MADTGPVTPTPDVIPDYMEAFTGWRIWDVSANWLHSRGSTVTWPRYQALVASHVGNAACQQCPCDEYSVPGIGLIGPIRAPGCGIYAYRTKDLLRDALKAKRWLGFVPRFAIGEVSLWGRMVEHKNGYRAQFAYPRRLVYITPSARTNPANIATMYGIPFEEDESWSSVFPSEGSWQNQSNHPYQLLYQLLPNRIYFQDPTAIYSSLLLLPPATPSQSPPSAAGYGAAAALIAHQAYADLITARMSNPPGISPKDPV